jgi:hypothetical protein
MRHGETYVIKWYVNPAIRIDFQLIRDLISRCIVVYPVPYIRFPFWYCWGPELALEVLAYALSLRVWLWPNYFGLGLLCLALIG